VCVNKPPPQSLHKDNETLKRIVAEQQSQLDEQQSTIASKDRTLNYQQSRIELLEEKLRLLQHAQYGRSSEKKCDDATLSLFNEAELLVDEEQGHEDDTSISVKPHKRRRQSFKDNLKDKPRVEVVYDLDEADKQCEHCGETMIAIGRDESEQLALLPLVFYVINHARLSYACPSQCGAKTAPMPKQPLPGTHASPVLLAWLATSKYLDGLPLYRLEKIAAREGVDLIRSTSARWLISASNALQPLYNLLQDTLFSYDIVMSDDTGIQVLKEDGRRVENKSYLWIRGGGPPGQPVVLVDYSPSKSGDCAYELLEQCQGYLVSDGAENFNQVVDRNNLTRVLCNDHARRYFDKALKTIKKPGKKEKVSKQDKTKVWISNKAIGYYKKLYQIEKEIKDQSDAGRLKARQDKAVPIWEALIGWATRIYEQGVAHDATRKALAYLLKHEVGLREYCKDARLPISNILSEHVAKTIALARKNFLFAATPAGAHASARLFGILETAKANGHNPIHYLTAVFTDLPNAQTANEIEALALESDTENRYRTLSRVT